MSVFSLYCFLSDDRRDTCLFGWRLQQASLPLSSYNKENLRSSQCLINHIYQLFLVTLPQQTEQVTPPYGRTSLTWWTWLLVECNKSLLIKLGYRAREICHYITLIQQAVCLLDKMRCTWHPAASPSFMVGFMVANQHCCFGSNILIPTLSYWYLWTFHLEIMFPSSLNGDETEVWGQRPVDIFSSWLTSQLAAAKVSVLCICKAVNKREMWTWADTIHSNPLNYRNLRQCKD